MHGPTRPADGRSVRRRPRNSSAPAAARSRVRARADNPCATCDLSTAVFAQLLTPPTGPRRQRLNLLHPRGRYATSALHGSVTRLRQLTYRHAATTRWARARTAASAWGGGAGAFALPLRACAIFGQGRHPVQNACNGRLSHRCGPFRFAETLALASVKSGVSPPSPSTSPSHPCSGVCAQAPCETTHSPRCQW